MKQNSVTCEYNQHMVDGVSRNSMSATISHLLLKVAKVTTIFGRSRDQNIRTLQTQKVYMLP